MDLRLLRVLVAVAVLFAGWLVADWFFSAERQIERRLTKIQRLVARTPAESEISSFATAREIAAMFAEPFEIRVEPEGYSTSDRGSLVGNIHQYRTRSSTLAMEVSGLEIFLDAEGTGGNTFFAARFIADAGDLFGSESYDVRMHWTKRGEWLIDHVLVSSIDRLP